MRHDRRLFNESGLYHPEMNPDQEYGSIDILEHLRRPLDGVIVEFMRILIDYPEILAWEKQDHLAREEMIQQMYDAAKKENPGVEFGAHVSLASQAKSLLDRAQEDYSRMLPYSDFFKLIVYHEIGGARQILAVQFHFQYRCSALNVTESLESVEHRTDPGMLEHVTHRETR